jgi:hypothetical protein
MKLELATVAAAHSKLSRSMLRHEADLARRKEAHRQRTMNNAVADDNQASASDGRGTAVAAAGDAVAAAAESKARSCTTGSGADAPRADGPPGSWTTAKAPPPTPSVKQVNFRVPTPSVKAPPPPMPARPPPPPTTPPPTGATAVAGALAYFDYEYFRGHVVSAPCHYRRHNVVLKYYRDMLEEEGKDHMRFSNTQPAEVAEIVHPKGPMYTFDTERMTNWKWQDMVAQLRAEDCQLVCNGMNLIDQPRSRGITGCRIQKTTGYDHKRAVVLKNSFGVQEKLHVWDFVLECDNGAQVYIHPNFTRTTFSWQEEELVPDNEMPRSGPGGSDGPGTFRRFKDKHMKGTMRFDAWLGNVPPKAKASATSDQTSQQ